MRSIALLGTALLVAASHSTPTVVKNGNSSTPAVPGNSSVPSHAYTVADVASSDINTSLDRQRPESDSLSLGKSGYTVADDASSSDITTVTVVRIQTSSIHPYVPVLSSSDAPSDHYPEESSALIRTSSLTWTAFYPTSSSKVPERIPSQAPFSYKNVTETSSAGTEEITTVFRGQCTGCALAALSPVTTSYESKLFGNWTSLVVTETIVVETITYLNNATIDTVVTETKTVNQTKTVNGITETAAEFNIYLPTPGLDLTLEIGPTYVLYTNLFGGPDAAVQVNATVRNNATHSALKPTQSTCRPYVSSLRGWIPTKTVDWDFFIQTFANGSTPEPKPYNASVPVPAKLRNFLAQDSEVQMHFQGADINTCSFAGIGNNLIGNPSRTFFNTMPPTSAPAQISVQPTPIRTSAPQMTSSFPVFSSVPGTNTFLSTTFESTSKHITKQGCLRCDTDKGDLPQPKPTLQDPSSNDLNDVPVPTKTPDPQLNDAPTSKDNSNNNNGQKTDGKPQDQPQNTFQDPPNPKPDTKTTTNVPDFISSVVADNPDLTRKPTQREQTVTIGDSVVAVKPQPTQQGQGGQDQKSNAPTVVIIGTQTVTVGQTTTINGVPIVVPTDGGGSKIVVGDSTITIGSQITPGPLPVLTIGHSTITANSEGQFVVGTMTLQRGGPMVVVDDNTLTLGPNGKIAIWNGATQTLVTMVGQPAVTFGGQSVTAKLLGGTTVFVVDGKTLGPGSVITADGTTYSLPSGFHGSSIVVNGQTRRLSAGLPALTVNSVPITATVADGTTEYVLAPGQTLTPGGVLVVEGTTYSLPTAGQGSTIIINGATSRLNPSHPPVLPLGSEEATATVAHGTTAFVFGPDQTLTPGGIVTVSGTTLSFPASASGSVIVINGVTSTLGSGSDIDPITAAPPIVVDGKTLTATTRDGTVEYVLNSATTLLPGGQVIIDGTTYSLAPGGTALIIDGKTSTLSTPASNSASATSNSASATSSSETTSERGAGDFIASGIGESSKGVGSWAHGGGADRWVENFMIGVAGWLLWLI